VAEAIPVCWALFKQSAGLQQALDEWILQRKHTLEFAMIVNKYTKLSAREQNKVRRQYQRAKAGIISPYDILLKNYARSANWDWRLLAALVFQESKFDPKARSRAGAVGLMQVLPATATWLGQKQIRLETPQANVKSGMLYLQWLKEKWQQHIYDKDEVIKFTLASYNAGFGHVWDARQLAKKYQLNPQRWEGNVERMLLQKSQPEYYQDPAVQYGYCRGKEPVDYVRNILAYYQHYQHVPL
jgi:membrane-bound lytic murein transglycosylase F